MEPIKDNVSRKIIVSPIFLFGSILVTASVFAFLIYHATMVFYTTDQTLHLSHLTPAKKEEFGGNPVVVDLGLVISHFRKFDMLHDEFIFDGVLTCAFDPSLTSLHTIDQISVERGEILYRSVPSTYIWEGKMYAHYDIQVKFSNYINYQLFPIDDHTLSLIFVHKYVSPSELVFAVKSNDFMVAEHMDFIGWHNVAQRVEAGYLQAQLGYADVKNVLDYPAVLFSMDYGRQQNLRNTFIIVLPMMMLFFISLFSLILSSEGSFDFAISLPIQGIVGVIAFRFVVESMSPQVGYFMYSDYFFFLFLFLMFIVLLFHTIGYNFGVAGRKIAIVALNAIAMLFFFYLLYI